MYGAFVYKAQNARKICHMEVVVETRCESASVSARSTSSEACVLLSCFVLSVIGKKNAPMREHFLLNKWIICVFFNFS